MLFVRICLHSFDASAEEQEYRGAREAELVLVDQAGGSAGLIIRVAILVFKHLAAERVEPQQGQAVDSLACIDV